MPKKNQTIVCSLLSLAAVFAGLIFLQVAGAKTGIRAHIGSPPGVIADREESILPTQVSYPAFTMTSSRTAIRNDGQTRLLSTLQRFQRSDGVFKTVFTSYTPRGDVERVQTQFGFIGLGVFRLDVPRRRLVFTGPQVEDVPGEVEQFLRAHPLFARAESVRGLNTIVWRKPGRIEGDSVEEFRTPALGGLLIKRVTVSGRQREIDEPTALEIGEPSLGLFTELVSLPLDYSHYERSVLEAERRNSTEVASLMRQLLERMRQIRPGESSEH